MNETAAREVLLVRAIERADTSQSLLSREDREFASRSATELARWGAAEKRAPLDPREFLARRARLLLDKLDERHQRALRFHEEGTVLGYPHIASLRTGRLTRPVSPRAIDSRHDAHATH
jgi:hypothetical protein